MGRQETIIITHSADPDGLVSAAFMMDILDTTGVPHELRFADYPNLAYVMEQTAKETGKSIYILDLALRKTRIPDEVIKPLLANNQVHYFDHHEIEMERSDQLAQGLKTFVSVNKQVCTARLIAEHYRLVGQEYEILANCAQGTDYEGSVGPELTDLGRELAQAISSVSGLAWETIAQIIKAGLHDHTIWRDGYQLIGELVEGATRTHKAMDVARCQLEQSASCHTLLNGAGAPVTVVVGMAAQCLYMKPGYQILRQKYSTADACFVLYESESVFAGPGINSKQPPVPILAFLQEQGGGGRDNMGGFQYKTPTHAGNYEERRDALMQDYERFLRQH